MSEELKACPFCGGEAHVHEKEVIGNKLKAFNGSRYSIQCCKRGCYLRDHYDVGYEYKRDAIREWNRRAK